MDELLQTRHAPEAASAFIPRCAGSVFFVPGTPAEVNGLMHGPWMRDLFRLIHLSLRTLQERIKAEVWDGAEGSPFFLHAII